MIDLSQVALEIKDQLSPGEYTIGSIEWNGLQGGFTCRNKTFEITIDLSSTHCICDDIISCDCDEIDNVQVSKEYTFKWLEKNLEQLRLVY